MRIPTGSPPGLTSMRLAVALAFALGVFAAVPESQAQEQPAKADAEVGPETNLALPRYVSLHASKVRVRRGPGLEYRIDWIFQRSGLPVRVIDEYRNWRRITDSDDAGGWVYHALLTGRRMALVTAPEVTFRAEPDDTAAATARAEQGVVAHLLQCQPNWCRVETHGSEGWLRKTAIWGVDADEVFGD
jgi:SH3-like domain-containing protein